MSISKNKWQLYLPWKSYSELYRTEPMSFIDSHIFVMCVTLLLSASDFMNIYTLFDYLLTENPFYSRVIGIVVAFSLNYLPVLLADYTHKLRRKESDAVIPSIIGGAFLVLFAFVFLLRWLMRGVVFSDSAVNTVNILSMGQVSSTAQPTAQQNAGALLLGVMPLITSILCFVFEYRLTPEKMAIRKLQRDIAKIDFQLGKLYSAHTALDKDWKGIFRDADDVLYNASVERIRASGNAAKRMAREILMTRINTPDGISLLAEQEVK